MEDNPVAAPTKVRIGAVLPLAVRLKTVTELLPALATNNSFWANAGWLAAPTKNAAKARSARIMHFFTCRPSRGYHAALHSLHSTSKARRRLYPVSDCAQPTARSAMGRLESTHV